MPSRQTTIGLMTAIGRYCCKSLFALVIKNSPGCRRDFRVKMWGTSSTDDKLTGDPRWRDEGRQIGSRRSDRLMAGKLSPGNFGLLQQYLPRAEVRAGRSAMTQSMPRDVPSSRGTAIVYAIA